MRDSKEHITPEGVKSVNGRKFTHQLETVTGFLDQHQGILQMTVTATAFAGLLVIGRSVRLVSKFRSMGDIPAEFVKKRVQLRGHVRQVQESGIVVVEHLPILQVPEKWLRKLPSSTESSGHLNMYLAGVSLQGNGQQYLAKTLQENPHIWFQPLVKDVSNKQLEAVVRIRKHPFSSRLLNEEVLKLGLGKVQPLLVAPSRYSQNLTKRLIKAEMFAERKRQGLWKPPSLRDRTLEHMSSFLKNAWSRTDGTSFGRFRTLLRSLFKKK